MVKEIKIETQGFKEKVKETITRDAHKIIKYGVIQLAYKTMGTSSRILPEGYGDQMKSCKLCTRERTYSFLGKIASQSGHVIVDVDLTSCYTSILCGLRPDLMILLAHAIKTKGIWKYIQEDFANKGQAASYNKPAVKVYTPPGLEVVTRQCWRTS